MRQLRPTVTRAGTVALLPTMVMPAYRRSGSCRFGFRSSPLPITLDEFFAGGWDYEGILAADPSLVDPKFRQPNQFLAPRELRFTVKFQF